MNDMDRISRSMNENIGVFMLEAHARKIIDEALFSKILSDVDALSRMLKLEPSIPKSIASAIYVAISSMRAEAPYLDGRKTEIEDMANLLEERFHLILMGECIDDRTPGVPKIS